MAISTFNAESIHNIKIEIDKKVFFEKELAKNKEHQLKLSDYFDYENPGTKTIKITWEGQQECEDKFMKIYRITINDQHIAPHSVMMTPTPNEYIQNLQATKEGLAFYRKKILNPGHKNGWYGIYKFKFIIDPHENKNTQQESYIASAGIRLDRVYTDIGKVKFNKRVNKK